MFGTKRSHKSLPRSVASIVFSTLLAFCACKNVSSNIVEVAKHLLVQTALECGLGLCFMLSAIACQQRVSGRKQGEVIHSVLFVYCVHIM